MLWNNLETKYSIFNGSAGMSGFGANEYVIHNSETGKNVKIGSLQKAKKTVAWWLSKQ